MFKRKQLHITVTHMHQITVTIIFCIDINAPVPLTHHYVTIGNRAFCVTATHGV